MIDKEEIKKRDKKQDKIVSGWINDVYIRIKADERLKKNKSMKQFENEYLNHF